jgi:hypothetical protein
MMRLYDRTVSYEVYTTMARNGHWACMGGVQESPLLYYQEYGTREDILNYVAVSPLFFASSASRFRARYLSFALMMSPSVF